MLIGFVILYLVISIGVGMYAATRVHTARDYVVAGRHLPIYIVTATVFATWFGSETVLGIPATFLNEGLRGIVSDPFGSSMCLILVGLFFARKLYRMNLLTLTDYYRKRYGRKVEVITGVAIIISYLGWVSAQMTALGLVFNILSQGVITQTQGTLIGAAIVLLYTLYGGMWSVALTDFFQMTIIVVGLLYILYVASDMAGGLGHVVQHAAQKGQFNFWPAANAKDVIAFIAAWITMMFGSIPQQDVFQRVMSAKSENIAVAGSVMGGSFYFFFAFVPLTIAYSATLIDPGLVSGLLDKDSQMILPQLILNHMPVFAQIMFFGALLSAIMSTASGTLLAPSVTFSENILKPYLPHHNDKTLLAHHACGGSGLRRHRHDICPVFQRHHLPDGGKCLQDHARGRLCSACRRPVLAARLQAGRLSFNRPGTRRLAADGSLATGRHSTITAAVRGFSGEPDGHGCRLDGTAVFRWPPTPASPCVIPAPAHR